MNRSKNYTQKREDPNPYVLLMLGITALMAVVFIIAGGVTMCLSGKPSGALLLLAGISIGAIAFTIFQGRL